MPRDLLRETSNLTDAEYNRQQLAAEEFLMTTMPLVSLICMYDGEMADAIIEGWESYDTMVSMFDPSRWMTERDQAQKNAKMVHIIRTAQKKLTELGLCPGR